MPAQIFDQILLIYCYFSSNYFLSMRILLIERQNIFPLSLAWWYSLSDMNVSYYIQLTLTCSKSCPNSWLPATTSLSAIHCSRSSTSRFSMYSFKVSSNLLRLSLVRSFRPAYSLSTCLRRTHNLIPRQTLLKYTLIDKTIPVNGGSKRCRGKVSLWETLITEMVLFGNSFEFWTEHWSRLSGSLVDLCRLSVC